MPEPERPDPADVELTQAEIDAAAATEAKQVAAEEAAAKKAEEPKRGRGRPPGARNKNAEGTARARAKKTTTEVVKPDVPAATKTEEENPDRAARQARNAARKKREGELVAEIKEQRPEIAKTLGLVSGIPQEFLVQKQVTETGAAVIDGDTGEPIEDLTAYGMMVVPSDGQIKAMAKAVARAEESEIGEKVSAQLDKFAPAFFMIVGGAALAAYTVSAVATLGQLKEQIAEEIRKQAEFQDQTSGAAG